MSSIENYVANFFSVNKILLNIGGLLFKKKNYNTNFKTRSLLFYSCFLVFYCQCIYTPAEFFMLTQTYKNLKTFMEHIGIIITHPLGMMKIFLWYYKHEIITGMLDTIQSNEFLYENCNDFNPGEIARKIKRTSDKINLVFFTFGIFVPTSKIIPSVLQLYHTKPTEFVNGTVTCLDFLPYFSWIPFATDTKSSCGYGMLFQFIPMTIYSLQIVGKFCYIIIHKLSK